MAEPVDERLGIFYAGAAYAIWGITPLYWRMLGGITPFEMTVHRILWCAVFVTLVSWQQGRLGRVISIFSQPRTLGILVLTGVLITVNWTIYLYCVASNRLVEASLGYYITPLLSMALGVFLHHEYMSRVRLAGVALGGIAVCVKTAGLGYFPWIAPALALSFGFYGFFRKRAPVEALDGLLVETWVLFPFALALVLFWAIAGTGAFPSSDLARDALLIGGGPLTAVPLAMFAAGARLVRLSTLGFLQYLSPTITLVLAVFGFHEAFTRVDTVAFGCVFAALVIVTLEGRFSATRHSASS